jgi:hypothetical protein
MLRQLATIAVVLASAASAPVGLLSAPERWSEARPIR